MDVPEQYFLDVESFGGLLQGTIVRFAGLVAGMHDPFQG